MGARCQLIAAGFDRPVIPPKNICTIVRTTYAQLRMEDAEGED